LESAFFPPCDPVFPKSPICCSGSKRGRCNLSVCCSFFPRVVGVVWGWSFFVRKMVGQFGLGSKSAPFAFFPFFGLCKATPLKCGFSKTPGGGSFHPWAPGGHRGGGNTRLSFTEKTHPRRFGGGGYTFFFQIPAVTKKKIIGHSPFGRVE